MELAAYIQIQDEVDCISFCVNALEKGMNPFVFLQAMGKY